MSVLELAGVSKAYAGGVVALREVDLSIAAGEDLAIVGPSGSGKSTLLHLMGTLDRPSAGRIHLAGEDATALSDDALSRLRSRWLGFVFQQSHLTDRLTAVENVAVGLLYAGTPRRHRRALAEDALDRVGLGHRRDHLPHQLSGGERQRVGIARALVNRPALVLADEPTGALDQSTGRQVLALFRELHAQGTTIALITHDPTVADTFSRRVEIRDGRITP
ncbi:ABC transporter ATP-binding protein [Nocardioides nitrophenolicus]|uniref:ABC transporter ATP-binding protein n=1 Tax=Nocardioides nitrophenolicus TaxID=60489 RepID=UPI00195A2CCA|nr:ABC transporter ATP-binding protein [Nocardioides nitrophenolicus]MBM7517203.1 putative ABC transport system ATP-binding protein [Nocardioides nitrophenolicus]